MEFGFVLVHGYTGSPSDFGNLTHMLEANYGTDSVISLTLPRHGTDAAPAFELNDYISSISSSVEYLIQNRKKPVFVGHSTGGNLILAYLAANKVTPYALILVSAPKRIDPSYLERWERQRFAASPLSLTDVAKLVKLINGTGSQQHGWSAPLMILHGARDELVPCEEAYAWRKDAFSRCDRFIIHPSADHHPFKGAGSAITINHVLAFIDDVCIAENNSLEKRSEPLSRVDLRLGEYLKSFPLSTRHFLQCPAGVEMTGAPERIDAHALNPPVFANIEPTTCCNLNCRFCARGFQESHGKHMSRDTFRTIISLLPHVFRINLVGLGEPLMNPHIVDLVSDAAYLGKSVGMVTNALLLERIMSRELLAAGLESITFSIDAPNQSLADELRSGLDFSKMIENIRMFMECASGYPSVKASVFCALSVRNIEHFEKIIDLAARLKVHGLMATDINFEQNISESLRENDPEMYRNALRSALSRSFSLGLPVLSIRGLEQFGLEARNFRYLLRPSDIFHRKRHHENCRSPWQCVPINSEGGIALCDCRPDKIIGNILDRPLDKIWNGDLMIAHRKKMIGHEPPGACLACPRF